MKQVTKRESRTELESLLVNHERTSLKGLY